MRRLLLSVCVVPQFMLFLPSAEAQRDEKYVPNKVAKAKGLVKGWNPGLNLGANFALGSSTNVVGQDDGLSLTLGFQVNGKLTYFNEAHEWRNTLKISEAFTMTPTIDTFVKSNDSLNLESIYLYHIRRVPWLGPFGQLKLDTALFPGRVVTSGPTTFKVAYVDGTSLDYYGTRMTLSDAFLPFRLQETLGMFAQPFTSEAFSVELKVGFSAKQVFADGQLAVDDDKDTAPVEIKELANAFQGGPAVGLDIKGQVVDGKISYYAGAELMLPVINNDKSGLGVGELMNFIAEAGLSFKLFSWASLDYKLKVLREPQVLDEFQVQNSLLLTFSYTLVEEKAPPKKEK